MNSELSDSAIRQIVLETENNFKRTERYNADFVSIALNEWRYATRHIVDVMCHVDESENRTRAVCHLLRARFDSYDILLDCVLDRFRELHEEYRDYASIVKGYVKDYADKIAVMRRAREVHLTSRDADAKGREGLYAEIAEVCEKADAFVKELEDTADDWRAEIRKSKRTERIVLVGVAAGIVAAIPTLIGIARAVWSAFKN